MRKETWADRTTTESNLWLNAIKMENAGNFFDALFLYLKNAEESLKQNSLVRAALSSSCAANCLSMTGNLAYARQLYLQTAILYEINGDKILAESIREALWSYQESYEYYGLSYDNEKAQDVYQKYVLLVRRVNPFAGEAESMKSLKPRTNVYKNNIAATKMSLPTQAVNTIGSFLKSVDSVCNKKNLQSEHNVTRKILSNKSKNLKKIRDEFTFEKCITQFKKKYATLINLYDDKRQKKEVLAQ